MVRTIYHGSSHIIEKPIFGAGKPYNDYGLGFYCTDSLEMAKEWGVSKDVNGYWAHYRTRFGLVYLYHKITDGKVDLTFNRAGDHLEKLEIVAKWLREHGFEGGEPSYKTWIEYTEDTHEPVRGCGCHDGIYYFHEIKE